MRARAQTDKMTLEEIRAVGHQVLLERLGPVGLVRFLQQYELGTGDYSTERHTWLNQQCVEDVAQAIVKQRS